MKINLFKTTVVVMVLAATLVWASDENDIFNFASYLESQGDYGRAATEYQRYLFMDCNGAKRDTIIYKIAECYRKNENHRLSNVFYERLTPDGTHPYQEPARAMFCLNLYYLDSIGLCKVYSSDAIERIEDKDLRANVILLRILCSLKEGQADSAIICRNKYFMNQDSSISLIDSLINSLKTLNIKSPMLAGSMSAIIPGAGKAYTGRFRDGLMSLAATSFTAWQAYEGYKDGKATSFKFIISMATGLSFYTANIYGSVMQAKIYNQQKQQAIFNEVENYILSRF